VKRNTVIALIALAVLGGFVLWLSTMDVHYFTADRSLDAQNGFDNIQTEGR
jgi:hypothetical protein